MVNAIPSEVLMPSTKYKGLCYPSHFFKSRGSIIRNIFLKCRTKKATLFARRNDFYALFATKKHNIYLIGIFRASVVSQNEKSPIVKSLLFLY